MCQTPSLLLCTTMVWHFLVIVVTCAISSVHCQERVGCFVDRHGDLLSAELHRNYTHMTIDWCLNVCLTQSGYVYAGLEAGYACFCGNDTDHTKYGFRRDDHDCYRPCPGDLSKRCGAARRLDIYQDADECCFENGGCNHECVDTPGSFHCSCIKGYQLVDGERHTCTDIDECKGDGHYCNQTCINKPGSYECGCEDGYELVGNETYQCKDVDECTEMNGGCNQECINSIGSYKCESRAGHRLKQDEKYNSTVVKDAIIAVFVTLFIIFLVTTVILSVCLHQKRHWRPVDKTGHVFADNSEHLDTYLQPQAECAAQPESADDVYTDII